jgi:hypothetical protein
MNNQSKISFTWLAIALGLVMHSAMEISSEVFFPEPVVGSEKGAGSMPALFHVIYIVAMILPMIVGFLSMQFEQKWFKTATLVYAVLLAVLNIFHFVEQITENMGDISQVVLLLFVAIATVVLVFWINNWRKETSL